VTGEAEAGKTYMLAAVAHEQVRCLVWSGVRTRRACRTWRTDRCRRWTPRADPPPADGYLLAVGSLSKAQLDAMVEEATVDCYNEDEQATGMFTLIEDNLAVPFSTEVLGVPVTVESVDLTDAGQIVAICTRDRARQAIPIVDLPLPTPPPEGAEWIDAYRHWQG
jgi:hypothetical protein